MADVPCGPSIAIAEFMQAGPDYAEHAVSEFSGLTYLYISPVADFPGTLLLYQFANYFTVNFTIFSLGTR